jgi:MFS family permease
MNLSILKKPLFRRYIASSFLALNGIWIQRITMGWLAWDMTQSASFVGLVAGLNFVPSVLSGPFFGVMADRIDLRRAAIAAQLAMLSLSILLLALFLGGLLGPGILTAMSLASGMAASAYSPIRMALVTRLAPREDVQSVVVITSMNFNLSRLSGPAIGGILIAKLGVGAALLALVLAPLTLIVVLIRLTLRAPDGPTRVAQNFIADMRAGFIYAAEHELVRRALIITGLAAFAGRGVLEILPAIADGAFARGAVGLGQLSAAAGAGALLSAVMQALGHITPAQVLTLRSNMAAMLSCVLVGVLGLTASWNVALGTVAGLGFLGTLIGVSLQSGIQHSLPDALRGRVMSLWVLVALGATAGGAFVQGALADMIGLSETLVLTGVAGFCLLLANHWRNRAK